MGLAVVEGQGIVVCPNGADAGFAHCPLGDGGELLALEHQIGVVALLLGWPCPNRSGLDETIVDLACHFTGFLIGHVKVGFGQYLCAFDADVFPSAYGQRVVIVVE